ncbi:MAG: tRNA (adenosine(37)-N6)-dimethylallyltransferase MiaA [Acidimicrobiales bacterium]
MRAHPFGWSSRGDPVALSPLTDGARRRDLAIVGPTATGKSALAATLSERLPGTEVVSIDALAVYRGLDVLTAKSAASTGVHLVDIADPSEDFSVADFQGAARAVVEEIHARGHVAVLAGGTGLYHRAAAGELDLPGRFSDVAAVLEAEADRSGGVRGLYERLSKLDPVAAGRIEPGNRRRLIRALEVTIGSGRPFSSYGPGLCDYPSSSMLTIGLELGRDELYARLDARLDSQLSSGLLDEVRALSGLSPPLSRTASQAIGYRELSAHLAGELSLDEALAEMRRRLRSFARRQEAWFRRDPRVVWLQASRPELCEAVTELWIAAGAPTVPARSLRAGAAARWENAPR